MITIPPGKVILSDSRTQHKWPVELAPHQLAAYPVTQAQYAEVTGQYPSAAKGDRLPVEGGMPSGSATPYPSAKV